MKATIFIILFLLFAWIARAESGEGKETEIPLISKGAVEHWFLLPRPLAVPVALPVVDGDKDARRGIMFAGGSNEGSTRSCKLPEIKTYGNQYVSCTGDSIVLELTAAGSDLQYIWQHYGLNGFENIQPDGDRIAGLKNNRVVIRPLSKEKDDGRYRCIVRNSCGEVISKEFTVDIMAAPTITVGLRGIEDYRCVNEKGSITLAIQAESPGNTHQCYWYKLGENGQKYYLNQTGERLKITLNSIDVGGTYTVEVVNSCGVAKDTTILPVYSAARVLSTNITENRDLITCIGEKADMEVRVEGGGSMIYALKKVDVITNSPLTYNVIESIPTHNSPNATLENIQHANEGYYIWEVENECGSDKSELFKLVADSLPTVTYISPDTTICEGAPMTLECEATSKLSMIKYEWLKDGEPTGVTGKTFHLDALSKADGGIYACVVTTNCLERVTSRNIKVIIRPKPVFLRDPYAVRPVCENDTAILLSAKLAEVVDSVRWYFNYNPMRDIDGKVEGSDMLDLKVKKLKESDIGIYHMMAYNECGATKSKYAELEVKTPATIVKGFDGYVKLVLCDGPEQLLTVKTHGSDTIRYRWLLNNRVIAESDLNYTPVKSGLLSKDNEYCVHVQNMCGDDVACAKLTVSKVDTFRLLGGGSYCPGTDSISELYLAGSDETAKYMLFKKPKLYQYEVSGTGGELHFDNFKYGRYYVVASDTNGCQATMPGEIKINFCDDDADLFEPDGGDDGTGGDPNDPENPDDGGGSGGDPINPDDGGGSGDDGPHIGPDGKPNYYGLYISRYYCMSSEGAELTMVNSDNDYEIEYSLYRKATSESDWAYVPHSMKHGNGQPVTWTVDIGEYKVVAYNVRTNKKREFLLPEKVELKPLPKRFVLYPTDSDYTYCSHELSDVSLTLNGFESGCSYRLYKNGATHKNIVRRSPVIWSNLEEGLYYVTSTNKWGCSIKTDNQRIVKIESPKVLSVTGGGGYCEDEAPASDEIVIHNSEPEVIYEIIKMAPDKLYVSVPGNGMDLRFMLPMEPSSYHVLAYDKTRTCSRPMDGTVRIRLSTLSVAARPSEVLIDRGTSTSLNLDITGSYANPLSISWNPESGIYWGYYNSDWINLHNDINYLKRPSTVAIYNNTKFTATVRDAIGCERQEDMYVNIIKKPLECELRSSSPYRAYWYCCGYWYCHWCRPSSPGSHCYFIRTYYGHHYWGSTYPAYDLYYCCSSDSPETVDVYKYDPLFFCSWANGGNYEYTYRWYSEELGDISYKNTTGEFFPTQSGWLWLEVMSDGQVSRDSVWLNVLNRPLEVMIKESSCNQRIDTTVVCEGDYVTLCGWARGGDGPHTYLWKDDEGNELASSSMLYYKAEREGNIYFSTWSDGVERSDTVHITLMPKPKVFEVENTGHRCAQVGLPQRIVLPETEADVEYYLEYSQYDEDHFEEKGHRIQGTGAPITFTVENPVEEPGYYRIKAVRMVNDDRCISYMEGVVEFIIPPSYDQLADIPAYCQGDAGAQVSLLSTDANMKYLLLTNRGTVLETIFAPTKSFSGRYQADSYYLRRVRVGKYGECAAPDEEFVINRKPLPDATLNIKTFAHGPLCEGEEVAIRVESTETDVEYSLITPGNYETAKVQGNGGEIEFPALSVNAGIYHVKATKDGCSVLLDDYVKINKLPKDIQVPSCSYCYDFGKSANSDSCDVVISKTQNQVRYYLYKGATLLDSIEGPGTKVLSRQPGGQYYVYAKNISSGCNITVGEFLITANAKPCIFDIVSDCGAEREIALASSQLKVNYVLYRNDTPIDTLEGTNARLSFGKHRLSGTYRVLGITQAGCREWMDGSVVIYQLDECELQVEGYYCEGSEDGVEITYPCSSRGWNFYLKKKDALLFSDTKKGNGETLWWNSVGGKNIQAGEYELYASNECETRLVTTAVVKANRVPANQLTEKAVYQICTGSTEPVRIRKQEKDVRYTLYKQVGPYWQEMGYAEAKDDKAESLIVGYADGAGNYKIVATNLDTTCAVSRSIRATELERANFIDVTGDDICRVVGNEKLEICVNKDLRETGVSYQLVKKGETRVRQSLTSAAASPNCYNPIAEIGCYHVIAVKSICRDTLKTLCLGQEPGKYEVQIERDKEKICPGDSVELTLTSSDTATTYKVLKDGAEYKLPEMMGTGDPIRLGFVKDGGTYTVEAYNGCSQTMRNSVSVTLQTLPGIEIGTPYEWCAAWGGATIKVDSTTLGATYRLINSEGIEESSKVAARAGGSVVFDGLYTGTNYTVEAVETGIGCVASKEIALVKKPMPQVFNMTSSKGLYICDHGCTQLGLDNSQANIIYELWNRTDNTIWATRQNYYGGRVLSFSTVCTEGEYVVVASYEKGEKCPIDMNNKLKLQKTDTLKDFRIQAFDTTYCSTNADAGATIVLMGWEEGVTYELYKDGEPTHLLRKGGPGITELEWTGLRGMDCTDNPAEVTEYTVVARRDTTGCTRIMDRIIPVVQESDVYVESLYPEDKVSICEGEALNVIVDADGCGLKYKWYKDGSELTDQKGEVLQIAETQAADLGEYYCEVSNTCGSEISNRIRVDVGAKITRDEKTPDIYTCEGKNAVLASTLKNVPEGSFKWYKRNTTATLSHSSYLEFVPARQEDEGMYLCEAKNRCGSVIDTCMLYVEKAIDNIVVHEKTDTICKGSPYVMSIGTQEGLYDIEWFHNGVTTGKKGASYKIEEVETSDEGIYTIRISNSCEIRDIKVVQLYVDDTVRLIEATDPAIMCRGMELDLFINTYPSDRVTYTWYEGSNVIGHEQRKKVKVGQDKNQLTYSVEVKNKCYPTFRHDINISIEGSIEITKQPEKEILLCAEAVPVDTNLCVAVVGTDVKRYTWFYRKNEFTSERDTLGHESCYTVNATTNATGFYYCVMETGCGQVSARTTWLVVDTMPTLKNNFADDLLCEGTNLDLSLQVKGGSLLYTWWKEKNGVTEKLFQSIENQLESTSSYQYGPLTAEDDGTYFWCTVSNETCGEVTSDKMQVSIDARREVIVNPDQITTCDGTPAEVHVELKNGIAPWVIKWAKDGRAEISDTIRLALDTILKVDEAGLYRITGLQDEGKCNYRDTLTEFTIDTLSVPTAVLSVVGDSVVCKGDAVTMQVTITGGVGPWKVTLAHKDGSEVDDLDSGSPVLYMTERIRKITISHIAKSQEFEIGEVIDLYNYANTSPVPVSCQGHCRGEAKFTVKEIDELKFTPLDEDHYGWCKAVDLKSMLNMDPADGTFYRKHGDGNIAEFSGILNNPPSPENAGRYEITYKTSGQCPFTTQPLIVYIDSVVTAEVQAVDADVCEGGDDSEKGIVRLIMHNDSIPYTVQYHIRSYAWDGTLRAQKDVKEVIESDTLTIEVPYTPQDSLRTYTFWMVSSKNECPWDNSEEMIAKVFMRKRPTFDVEARTRTQLNNQWGFYNSGMIGIPKGDQVQFKVNLLTGGVPWMIRAAYFATSTTGRIDSVKNIVSRSDSSLFEGDPGLYKISVVDAYGCGSSSTTNVRQYNIYHLDTGYMEAKVFLEGPYQTDTKKMKSDIQSYLPLYKGISSLPAGLDIIDWVELEFREDIDQPSWLRDTVLLTADGTLVDCKGNKTMALQNVGSDGTKKYYVVINHRNHLSIASKNRITLYKNKASALSVDLTQMNNLYSKDGDYNAHMKYLGIEGWAMAAGDIILNRLISVANPNDSKFATQEENTQRRYYKRDINFDGIVDWPPHIDPGSSFLNGANQDAWIIYNNRNKYSEIKSAPDI